MTTYQFPTTKSQRTCRRVLRMVAELHTRGYQLLRICPEAFPFGDDANWACNILARRDVSSLHGARGQGELMARYESVMGRRFFGWSDAEHATPSQLADMFLQRFPELAQHGLGMDWAYASWYALMMTLTFPGALPIADHPIVDTDHWLRTTNDGTGAPPILIPRPPGGERKANRVSDFSAFVGSPESTGLASTPPATPKSFGTPRRMPAERRVMRYARWLPSEYFAALCLGFVPSVMEDKWFAYVRGKTLFLHRSWTGICIWTVRFEQLPAVLGGGFLATETLANCHPKQVPEPLPNEGRLLDQLVVNLARNHLGLSEY